MDQAIDESAGPDAAGGMDHQVGLLVEGEEMLVFVNDVERDGLGNQLADRLGRRDHFDLIARARAVAGLDDAAVHFHQAFVDQFLHAVAREVGDAIGEVLVDAAGEVFADAESEVLDIRRFFGVGGDLPLIGRGTLLAHRIKYTKR